MHESFAELLTAGGKTNSLGRADEVIAAVLADPQLLEELYHCLFNDNAWVRMRAADSLEKVCRQQPQWLEQYIDRLQSELSGSNQASIQWHLAQIYKQVRLTPVQKRRAIKWLSDLLATTDVDWIVAANSMETLAHFARGGAVPPERFKQLVQLQTQHRSKAVVKRANKLLGQM